jgi:two-component system, OmpR family, response regulator
MKKDRTILFIDDDRDFLAAQCAFFGARGYKVLAADGAEAAKSILARERPDVVILDLMMEHFDSGFALGRLIRKDPRFEKTPIIMLSGVAAATGQRLEDDAKTLTIWSCLDAFMDKPVSARDLLRAVEARIGTRPTSQPQAE